MMARIVRTAAPPATRRCSTPASRADFADPGYGLVHHRVVPTYGLQHGWYPTAVEPSVVEFVPAHLDQPPSDHARRSIREATDGPIQVRARQPRHRHVEWGQHVGDVDRSGVHDYVTTVRSWAMSVATTLLQHEREAIDNRARSP